MKKGIIILATVLGLNSFAMAQADGTATTETKSNRKTVTPEQRAKKASERAAKKLGLTEEQKGNWEVAALKRIMVNQPILEKLKGSTTPEERKQMRQQVRENNQAFDSSVDGFLTDEQKPKYEAWKAEAKSNKKGKKGSKGKKDEESVEKSVDE